MLLAGVHAAVQYACALGIPCILVSQPVWIAGTVLGYEAENYTVLQI